MATEKQRGEPFSIRLAKSTERLVEAEARRTKRSKSSIVESLTEEAARVRRFPGIGFHGDDYSRSAWVIGTGLDAWEVIEMLRDYGSPELLAKESHLSPRQVQIASAYAEEYSDEIDEAISENKRSIEDWRSLYPFIEWSSG